MFELIIAAFLIVLSLYFVAIYNHLVALKHNTDNAWSEIDVILKQRHSELPKLIEVCKRYMHHESDTLERVMLARNNVMHAGKHFNIDDLGTAEKQLRQGILGLYATAEAYPNLKADQNFLELQARISELENGISDRRTNYNHNVTLINTRIEQFPDLFIARLFAFKAYELLQFSEQEIQDIEVNTLFDN